MYDLIRDLRFSLRSLRRRPVAALTAVVILALGLTASTAVFTYLNGFFEAFPGVDADGLVRLFAVDEETPYQDISYLDFLDYRAAQRSFDGVAAARIGYAASVRHEEFTEVAFIEPVSGDYFSVLDVHMQLGRGLKAQDDHPGAESVAVLSHAWWVSSFGGEESVIGSTVYLNYRPFTVVGVAAPDYIGATAGYQPQVWVPFAPFADRYTSFARAAENRDLPLVRVYGRLRDGATTLQGREELDAIAAGLDEAYPRPDGVRRLRLDDPTWIDPRSRVEEMPTVRIMMFAAVGLLFLVCANVANLLLAIAAGRQRDVAIRAALGAPPRRLLRQTLLENVLLSVAGGVIALLLAGPLAARIGSYFARPSVWGENFARTVSVDAHVLLFALGVSVLTGLVAGVLPAWRATFGDALAILKADSAGAVGAGNRLGARRVPGLHDLLVALQVALSIVLVVVAGLLMRTLDSVSSIDPGFDYEPTIASYISTSSTSVQEDGRERFFRELSERLSEEPWVRQATIAYAALLSYHGQAEFRIDGQSEPQQLTIARVNPGFFATVGIDLLQGRAFEWTDVDGAPDVAIVNEALARRFLPDGSVVGRRLVLPSSQGGEERSFEIVGVASNAKVADFLADVEPTVFLSYPQQTYTSGSALMVKTTGDPAAAVPRLRAWLREFEPQIAIVNILPYTDVVRGFTYVQRMNAELFGMLAVLGLSLAAAGIFSVMSLSVSRRRREIGVRMAMGARHADIGRLVVRRALGPVVLGLILGVGASFLLTRFIQAMLVGVEPSDPLTLAAGTAVMVVAALWAVWLPARRAATVDPVIALRRE
ncbi:MAG: ABC transporter permease [Acidobacteriota bacterium]|jgi:predicted permease